MNNHNEQFVEAADLEKVLSTKIVLTSSYQTLVADLQTQNQQLTEKLIVAMKENVKLRDQLFTNKGLAKVNLPNISNSSQEAYMRHNEEMVYFPNLPTTSTDEVLKGYASPF